MPPEQCKSKTYVGKPSAHESATKHVSGLARYTDDIFEANDLVHLAVGYSEIACGKIKSIPVDDLKNNPGVIDVITASDIPGKCDIGPVFSGDPLLASEDISFHGQVIFVVAAESYEIANQVLQSANVQYEENPPLLDPVLAVQQKRVVRPSHAMQRGDLAEAFANAKHQLSAGLKIGGQEHYYLEGQVSVALPTEDGGVHLHCSTQHPSEVQKLVAKVLNIPLGAVSVETRRMGGGFGGKETQAAQWACLAAVVAWRLKRPAKLRLPRKTDMISTGKRHPFVNSYRLGFDDEGLIQAAEIELIGDCGYSPDLSDAIVDRAMFHSDNAYYFPAAKIVGHRAFTNKVSNTAFRGFGAPQGMLTIECAMDDIARKLGKDPLEIRKLNLYDANGRNETPYHQTVEQHILPDLISELETSSDYWERRKQISTYNKKSRIFKKGLALTPVKFGVSFTVQHLNQAGALVHVYTDGSVQVNHGGTEMGQGLNTKVAQIVAEVFQIDLSKIHITATRTDKVPNTSPTAASSGSDLNGQAAKRAAEQIKARLIQFLCEQESIAATDITFKNGEVYIAENKMSFSELVEKAYLARVSLSSTGFYKTPKIFYDREKAKGRPFFYYANGAAVSEVVVDTVTGEYKVERVDILHDVGDSLNPALDIGQIEGGFIQGMGWLTTEELKWDEKGRLLTTGAASYKIPAISDTPAEFNVDLLKNRPNEEETIYHSKAVGEPPFMLSISVWSALRDAISSVTDYKISPELDAPATPERVYFAIQKACGSKSTDANNGSSKN